MLEDIFIPQLLRCPQCTRSIDFKEFFEGLETLIPVQGSIVVRHGGAFLEVKAQASTIITLTCDRTLEQFNHRLQVQPAEIIPLSDNAPAPPKEQEIAVEDLVESLSSGGYFSPKFWIYEHLCLEIPFPAIAPNAPSWECVYAAEPPIDNRWGTLRNLHLPD